MIKMLFYIFYFEITLRQNRLYVILVPHILAWKFQQKRTPHSRHIKFSETVNSYSAYVTWHCFLSNAAFRERYNFFSL